MSPGWLKHARNQYTPAHRRVQQHLQQQQRHLTPKQAHGSCWILGAYREEARHCIDIPPQSVCFHLSEDTRPSSRRFLCDHSPPVVIWAVKHVGGGPVPAILTWTTCDLGNEEERCDGLAESTWLGSRHVVSRFVSSARLPPALRVSAAHADWAARASNPFLIVVPKKARLDGRWSQSVVAGPLAPISERYPYNRDK